MSIFKPKKGRALRDIEVQEISLVPKASTGKIFYIIKQADATKLVDRLELFLPVEDPDKAVLCKIAGILPAAEGEQINEHLASLIEYKDDLTPDVLASSQNLVSMALGSAAIGPDPQNEEALTEAKEIIDQYEDDYNGEMESALTYFAKMAAEGLPDLDYSELEEEEDEEADEEEEEDEQEGSDYVARYPSDYRAGDKILTREEAINLTKSGNEKPLFPSLMIGENDTRPGALGMGMIHVGKSIYKSKEEADPDDENLSDKELIAKLEAKVKELKRPQSKQLSSDDLEEIEKGEEVEFIWESLISD